MPEREAGSVLRLDIAERIAPIFGGASFGDAGPYEWLGGSALCDIDPLHALNAGIANIEHARRGVDGRVAYRVDFCTIKPIDLLRGNGWLLHELPNRGTKRAIQRLNNAPPGNRPLTPQDAGNGYLMRHGWTLCWSAWQGDLVREPARMQADLPVATRGGAPITGTSREEFILDARGVVREDTNAPIVELSDDVFVAPLHYPAAEQARDAATLTVRQYAREPRATPPDLRWRWLDAQHIEVTRPRGFDRGAIYEFIYTARDPVVLGIGLASIRDIVSFLRHEPTDRAGQPNPLAIDGRPALRRALGFGISQSGRALRDFLHGGFNADGRGRPVFDAAMPVTAGSRRAFLDAPFGQVGRFSRQHEDHDFPGDGFPFTYDTIADPIGGRSDGILARARATGTCPKIMHVDTSSEIWSARASLVVTDCAGADLRVPDDVRVYLASGAAHVAVKIPEEIAAQPHNPLGYGVLLRALLAAMVAWVDRGVAPPDSRFPSRAAGTLINVDGARAAFPAIPGVAFPAAMNALTAPAAGETYPAFVERVDADGNAVGGLRHPLLMAPLGTHTGWQIRKPGYAAGALFNVFGAFIPFAATRQERIASGDPRLSLEERYGSHEGWQRALAGCVGALVAQRLLLQEDADRLLAAAQRSWAVFDAI